VLSSTNRPGSFGAAFHGSMAIQCFTSFSAARSYDPDDGAFTVELCGLQELRAVIVPNTAILKTVVAYCIRSQQINDLIKT
jgi:hypothetical protein